MFFNDLLTLLDYELKQDDSGHITSQADNYRIAKEAELIAWTNQSLKQMVGWNPTQWRTQIAFTPAITSTKMTIPRYFKELYKIRIGDEEWQKIYYATVDDADGTYRWFGKNEIEKTNGNFEASTEIKLYGVFYPDIVVDVNSEIDVRPEDERLLILSILLKANGRDNQKSEIWYYEQQGLIKEYKASTAYVRPTGKYKPGIRFGR